MQHAAELPFVKELCRVTFAVREFTSDQFKRTLALRMRSARQALGVLAGHTGVAHSFRNVHGSAVGLLQETSRETDITAFEPARPHMMSGLESVPDERSRKRVSVLLADPASAEDSIRVALQLAHGHADRISVLLLPKDGGVDALRATMRRLLPDNPAQVPATWPAWRLYCASSTPRCSLSRRRRN